MVAPQQIRDKWEMNVKSSSLQDKLHYLKEIQDQLLEAQNQINAFTDKRNMHQRDADYVAQAIVESLPETVVQKAKQSS